MKIVIDISEGIYQQVLSYNISGNILNFIKAIKNGTPLPKGHGRLIDYECVVDAIDDWINTGEYSYTNATDYLRKRVKSAPTIIEGSDKE